MEGGVVSVGREGSAEGRGLSGIVWKMVLEKVEKEVEKGKVSLVGYGDDWSMYVRREGGGERVLERVRGFVEDKVVLGVKGEKSKMRGGEEWDLVGLGLG